MFLHVLNKRCSGLRIVCFMCLLRTKQFVLVWISFVEKCLIKLRFFNLVWHNFTDWIFVSENVPFSIKILGLPLFHSPSVLAPALLISYMSICFWLLAVKGYIPDLRETFFFSKLYSFICSSDRKPGCKAGVQDGDTRELTGLCALT